VIDEALSMACLFTLISSSVKLNANRVVIGTLRGFDQFMNLVVDNTVEVNGNDKTDIGMVVICQCSRTDKLLSCFKLWLANNMHCKLTS
jgi:small nuclear ribonucleoprotein (snRNP)-like protein